MRIDARLGTYEQIAALVPRHAPVLDAIRATVHRLDPEGVEVASPGERSVWRSTAGAKMKDGYAYAMPHARHVNLGFFRGVALPDPEGLLEGTGKALRHVKLRDPADALEPAVTDLLRAAIAERRAAHPH
jgi:hypothetical protein